MFSFIEDTFGSIWSLSCLAYWCLMDFCRAPDIHTGAYFPLPPRFLSIIRLCDYPYSWLWRCLVDFDKLFIVHQISTLGHIPLSPMRLCLGSGTRMDDHCLLFTSWLWYRILYWGIFPSFSLSILEVETVASLVLDWVLAQSFRRSTVLGPPYMDLLR